MYEDCKGVEIHSINRVEWVANELMREETPFSEFTDLLIQRTKEMVEREHLTALKSVIAYYTGLEVKILPEARVKAGYERFLADPTDGEAEKIVRDYTFLVGCQICRELDIPLRSTRDWETARTVI